MKGGHSPDSVQLAQEFLTALHLRFFQFIKRVKVAIGDTFVGQRPEPFAWLQLGGVRWQEDEMQPFGNDKLGTVMPACPIEHQCNVFGRTSADALCKLLQGQVHHSDVDPGQEQPNGSSRKRMHEGVDVHPFIAGLHHDPRAGSFAHPDAAEQRLETNAMLIECPQLDARGRMVLLDLG
jgi:hypothetical protein